MERYTDGGSEGWIIGLEEEWKECLSVVSFPLPECDSSPNLACRTPEAEDVWEGWG